MCDAALWQNLKEASAVLLSSKEWLEEGTAEHADVCRLALAVHWLSLPDFIPLLDDWICHAPTRPSPASGLLRHLTVSNEYWSTHWNFRSRRFDKAQPLIGLGLLHDIAVNVVLPWL